MCLVHRGPYPQLSAKPWTLERDVILRGASDKTVARGLPLDGLRGRGGSQYAPLAVVVRQGGDTVIQQCICVAV